MSKTRSIQKCDYCGGRGTTKDMLNICPECDGRGYNHVERKIAQMPSIDPAKTKIQRGRKNLDFLSRDPVEIWTKDYGILYPDRVCWHQPRDVFQEEFGDWVIQFR